MTRVQDRVAIRYRKLATLRPEVALHSEGGTTYLSILIGTQLGVYERPEPADDTGTQIEKLNGSDEDDLWKKAEKILRDAGYRFSVRGPRDRVLSQKQKDRKEEAVKERVREFRKWLDDFIPMFVKDIYEDYHRGKFRAEPCVTAGFVRSFLKDGGKLPGEHQEAFESLSTKQQLALLGYTLEMARKRGQLQVSTGLSNGRETRCYEPT